MAGLEEGRNARAGQFGQLAGEEEVNEHALKYLNRLSDWFFFSFRIANDDGRADVLWVPGANR